MVKKTGKILAAVLLIGIILVNIFPFLYMFLMSFKSTINAGNISLDPKEFTLVQYKQIFALEGFTRFIVNSVVVAAAGVLLAVAVSTIAGFAFAKLNFKGNDRLFFSMILTLAVPSEVILVPLFLITKNLGLLNTYWALILPLPTAVGVFILRQAVLSIPNELIDAARIDGASRMRIFFRIVLPLSKSAILALAIFTFVGAWNNYTWPLVACTEDSMKTLPLALNMMKTQYNADVGLTMACAVINFIPPFVFYLFMQKQFKAGMTMSGLK